MNKPLNGAKTHPLSEHSREVLRRTLDGPIPCQEANPGSVNRLARDDLVRIVDLETPYRTRSGAIPHMEITDKGRKKLLDE